MTKYLIAFLHLTSHNQKQIFPLQISSHFSTNFKNHMNQKKNNIQPKVRSTPLPFPVQISSIESFTPLKRCKRSCKNHWYKSLKIKTRALLEEGAGQSPLQPDSAAVPTTQITTTPMIQFHHFTIYLYRYKQYNQTTKSASILVFGLSSLFFLE